MAYRAGTVSFPTQLDPRVTFDASVGLQLGDVTTEEVRAQIPVHDGVKQAMGLVHGGVYASAAEAMASLGTALGVYEAGNMAVGLSNSTSFLRPITAGTIHAVARRRHRGRTTWIWDVEVTDDDGHLCAMSRVTIAVRPLPDASGSRS